jgi:hypothetical protein
MKDLIIEDDLFDQDFIETFHDFSTSSNHWFFGRKGDISKSNMIWGSILYEKGDYRNFMTEYIFRRFTNKYNINADILSCVLNGQTKGQSTTWHVDIYENDTFFEKKYTLLYYVNRSWDDSGGSTIIRFPDRQEEKILFTPGRVIFFPSVYQHYAESPESENLLRITCAYKLELTF